MPSFLMLHSVGEEIVDPECPNNTIRPGELKELMLSLRKDSYTFKTFKELNCPATCFVTNRGNPAFPKERWSHEDPIPVGAHFLTAEMLREMDASGLVEFGGHTASHTTLTNISLEEARQEIKDNKRWIEETLGHGIVSFCYPRGEENDEIVEIVKAAGYRYGAAMKKKMRSVETDLFRIHRQIIPRGMETWKSALLAKRGR